MRLAVFGASGRLGRRVVELAGDGVTVVGAWTHASSKALGTRVGGMALTTPTRDLDVDVYLDVSVADGIDERLALVTEKRRPLVVGSTGLSDAAHASLRAAASATPVFYAPNFSLGMAVLYQLARDAARLFHPHADIDLVESHHSAKRDAPSGAARILAKAVQSARPQLQEPRIHSIRSGAIVGEHELRLNVADEQLVLRHEAHTRDVFARGALAAVQFIERQPPGLYGMEHLIARSF